MTLPAYPIAQDGHEALALFRAAKAPRATRQNEAQGLSGTRVAFVSETIGPVYERREDALDAYAGLVEDDRSGHLFAPAPQDAVCVLLCRLKSPPPRRTKPVQPVFRDGERWPKTVRPAEAVWQLSISYWKLILAHAPVRTGAVVKDQARRLRKSAKGSELTPDEIRSLIDNPLTAARPQKSLDFGLFDFIPPDQPDIVIADE
ncbi:MAG: hypothetical protein ACXU8U_00165 [Asticcacaulis sp.]